MRPGAGTWLFAILLALALVPSASAAPPLSGQWHLDESTFTGASYHTPDSSGNGFDLETLDQIPLVAGRFGLATAITDQDEVPQSDQDLTALQPTSSLTLLAWVKSAAAPGDDKYIAGLGAGSDTSSSCANNHASYALYSGSAATPGLQFYFWDGTAKHASPAASAALWDGNFHLVAGTYDGASVRLYVDGAEVGSGTAATQAISYAQFSDLFAIGDYPYLVCANRRFPGNIDEVRVYDRALTAAEVGQLAAATGPDPPVLGGSSTATPSQSSAPPPASPSGCAPGSSSGVKCQTSGGVTTIEGTQGDDTIAGTPGPDLIRAGGGNDSIVCGPNDICLGEAGDDRFVCTQRVDGDLRCDGGPGKDSFRCQIEEGRARCSGGEGKDKLECALSSKKRTGTGGGGGPVCDGGDDADKLYCKLEKEGPARCDGDSGPDKLVCTQRVDGDLRCDGGPGKDSFRCLIDEGRARCSGGEGADRLACALSSKRTGSGGGGGARCDGGPDADKLYCKLEEEGGARSRCDGGPGPDKLVCTQRVDGLLRCDGGPGKDSFRCTIDEGRARCSGGEGADRLACALSSKKPTGGGGGGGARCDGGPDADKLYCKLEQGRARCDGGPGADKLECTQRGDGLLRCEGGPGKDALKCELERAGQGGRERCSGGPGDDKVARG